MRIRSHLRPCRLPLLTNPSSSLRESPRRRSVMGANEWRSGLHLHLIHECFDSAYRARHAATPRVFDTYSNTSSSYTYHGAQQPTVQSNADVLCPEQYNPFPNSFASSSYHSSYSTGRPSGKKMKTDILRTPTIESCILVRHSTTRSMSLSPSSLAYEGIRSPRTSFAEGRILVVPWHDPHGRGILAFTIVRLFVVIRTRSGHSICHLVHTCSKQPWKARRGKM
ncbi:hypothetical protein BDV95DRAFT_174809 [Massariosphaeria phaeospora]|uniref:Uncharacterized protein n=1 Tax=Massariosphaeria phaeospora TaxID=100035 RepID=A0A7C8I0W0_9PLEO|nr:hypothetical protein BDV95DRAFT_174809 [Massariosphaeria phaeospora]